MMMLSHADLPTMLLMILVTSGAMAFAVLFVSRYRRNVADGLSWWGGGLLLNTLAFIVYGALGSSGMTGLVVVGNVLMSASAAAAFYSLVQYRHAVARHGLIWGPVVATGVLSCLFVDRPLWRVPSTDFLMALQTALVAWVAIRPDGPSSSASPVERGRILLLAGSALLTVVYLCRVVVVLLGNENLTDLSLPDWSQTLSYMLGLVCILFATLGFILMHKERSEQLYRQLAFQDALTAIPNRRALMDTLRQMAAQAARARTPLAVMMADIDFFKQVNDRHGHLVGDMVLTEVAQRLRRRLRGQDVVGRYGGEEFLAVFPATDLAGASVLAEDLRRGFEQEALCVCGHVIPITLSIGVHCRTPETGADVVETMVAMADGALYAAKNAGRNQVRVAP